MRTAKRNRAPKTHNIPTNYAIGPQRMTRMNEWGPPQKQRIRPQCTCFSLFLYLPSGTLSRNLFTTRLSRSQLPLALTSIILAPFMLL